MNELLARSQAKKQKPLSKAELKIASDQVKAHLVVALQNIVAKLASQPDSIDIAKFSRLVETAAKLFAWPSTRSVAISAVDDDSPATQLRTAINLALIRTTPEQLRAKARLIAQNSSNEVIQPEELAS